MTGKDFTERSRPFLEYLDHWYSGLAPMELSGLIAADPDKVAVFCVDMINGFTTEGTLASPRVASHTVTISDLFRSAYEQGVRQFVLPQDSHSDDAEEFATYPPHARTGTHEAETVPEIASLPFADIYTVIPKNSLSPAIGTDLDRWLDAHPDVRTAIVVGDCSDLCLYQLAMYLRLRANQFDERDRRIIVPANGVDTYGTSLHRAHQFHIDPHPGDFYHYVFLNHLHLNGVEVVASVT